MISNISNGLSIWVSHKCAQIWCNLSKDLDHQMFFLIVHTIDGSINTTPFLHSFMYMAQCSCNFCNTISGKDTFSYMNTFWIYIFPQTLCVEHVNECNIINFRWNFELMHLAVYDITSCCHNGLLQATTYTKLSTLTCA